MPKLDLRLALCALAILGATAVACTSDSEPDDAAPTASSTATATTEDSSVDAAGTGIGDATTIANTDGRGVALRSDCTDDAASGGAWAETTIVAIEVVGSGDCAGWSRVSSGVTTSWVQNQHLEDPPAAAGVIASSDGSSSSDDETATPSSTPTTTNPAATSTPKAPPTTNPTPKPTVAPTTVPKTPEPPTLTASTYLLDFGAQALGEGTARSVTLRNNGTETVTIVSARFDNGATASGYFQTAANSCVHEPVLAPTSGCGISIAFVPQVIGEHTARLEIYLQGRSTPIIIRVRGDATFD